jgi:acetyl esterase/lipase
MGHISQMGAALTHHVTQDRLARIAKSVPKVVILTGDDDYLVRGDIPHAPGAALLTRAAGEPVQLQVVGRAHAGTCSLRPDASARLLTHTQEAQYVQWEKTGHALHGQWPERFNQLLEDAFREGQQRVRDGWVPAV